MVLKPPLNTLHEYDMSENNIKYMIESIAAELAEFLTNDFEMTIPQALNTLYNSTTYNRLSDPKTGLYFQSPLYVYSFLKTELTTGKFA